MAKVQAIKKGYYNHARVKPGTEFEMPEVDKDGFYIDDKGKRKLFPKLDREGKKVAEEERKCRWVGKCGSYAKVKVKPEEVAAVISGKKPGVANPLEKPE